MTREKIAIVINAFLITGCSHYYYVPNAQNIPLFREKNEYRFCVINGISESSISTEIQSAYSITKNIGIMTNFMSARYPDYDGNRLGKENNLEGAIGYFKPFGKSAVAEIYGGIGGNRQSHKYRAEQPYDTSYSHSKTYGAGTSELSFIKFFIQPSIGLTFNAFDLAFSTRISRLAFNKIDNRIDSRLNEYEFKKLNSVEQIKNFLVYEPALTIRTGWKYVKVQLQIEFDRKLNNRKYAMFNQTHVSFGLLGSFGPGYLNNRGCNPR